MIVSGDVDALLVADHREILDSYSWSRRKADTTFTLIASSTTGTISSSSTTVTGASTAFASTMIGGFIRGKNQNYFSRITAVASATSLTISPAFASNLAAGSTYTIFVNRYNLPSDFGRITSVTSSVGMRELSREQVDRLDPYRESMSSNPEYYFIDGLDPDTTTSQLFQIEFWPVPSSANMVRAQYLKSNNLSSDSDEPLYRSDVLVWKTAESGSFFLHGKTGDAAWLALSDRFHARYLEALEASKADDFGKSSPAMHIRDTAYDDVHGEDWYLSHDSLRLR